MSKGILILGSHRSGSSCAAIVCERNGFYGGQDLINKTDFQKEGYGESYSVVQLNDEMLKRGGGNLYTPINNTQISQEDEYKIQDKITNKFREYNRQGRWVLKDPRIAYLLKYWRIAIEQTNTKAYYLITYRHPYNTTASLIARHKGSQWKKELRWTELKNDSKYKYYLQSWYNSYEQIFKEFKMLLNSSCVFFINYDEVKKYREKLRRILKCIEATNWDMRSIDDDYRHQMFTQREIDEQKIKEMYDKLIEHDVNQWFGKCGEI